MTAASSVLASPVHLTSVVLPSGQATGATGFEGAAWALSLEPTSDATGKLEPLSVLVFTVSLGALSVISLVALLQVLGLA
jgi:hypothetical protein